MVNYKEVNKKFKQSVKINFAIFAVICIAVGLIFLGRNTGIIDENISEALKWWKILLVVAGIYSISHRAYFWGALLAGIGLFFMIPPLVLGVGEEWTSAYWPLIFVFLGALILIKIMLPNQTGGHFIFGFNFETDDIKATKYSTEDGFVNSTCCFGEIRHVVMDEVFRGAKISNAFGETVIDLRRTTLQAGETYAEIKCSFGAVEIILPDNWFVLINMSSAAASVCDERYKQNDNVDESRKLILSGKAAFGSIVIKN